MESLESSTLFLKCHEAGNIWTSIMETVGQAKVAAATQL